MLCQFVFENFKSFKDEAVLDLYAERISEHEDSLIVDKYAGDRYLPIIAIYGPNGGGKTSILEAFVYLRSRILLKPSIKDKEMDEGRGREYSSQLGIEDDIEIYHRFDKKCATAPTRFEIIFRIADVEYKYQISLLSGLIVEENLYQKDNANGKIEIVFERNESDFFLGDVLSNIIIGGVSSSLPLLSHIALNFDNMIIKNIINWFRSNIVLNYDLTRFDKRIVILKDKTSKEMFFKMLSEMDIGIADIRTVENSKGEVTDVFTKHSLKDGVWEELQFENESSGTKKLFGLLPYLIKALRGGGLVIADEMDAKLHPKLLGYVIQLFTNPIINKNGAQLIFTSHDMTTMKSSFFRRDEIWFSALNQEYASKLYSLVQFRKENGAKARNDETYGKQYIEGRYGADPYLRRIIDWEAQDEQ